MRFARNENFFRDEDSRTASEKRRKGRIRADVLQTSLGTALDISESGIRIERKGRCPLEVGAKMLLVLKSSTATISCPAKLCWKKKAGWFKSQIGLQFLDDSETFRRTLREFTRGCMDMRTFSADSEDLARRASG